MDSSAHAVAAQLGRPLPGAARPGQREARQDRAPPLSARLRTLCPKAAPCVQGRSSLNCEVTCVPHGHADIIPKSSPITQTNTRGL